MKATRKWVLLAAFLTILHPSSVIGQWWKLEEKPDPRMSMDDVKAEYSKFVRLSPETKIGIELFAAQMDTLDGADKRFVAYQSKPELYPQMPMKWIESDYRKFRKTNKDSTLTILDYAWQADCREGGVRRFEAYKEHYAGLTILYGFMAMDQFPIPSCIVVEKRPGYIKLLLKSGETIEHSGKYSVVN